MRTVTFFISIFAAFICNADMSMGPVEMKVLPLQKIIKNLETHLRKTPKDKRLLLNLARAYYIAAEKSEFTYDKYNYNEAKTSVDFDINVMGRETFNDVGVWVPVKTIKAKSSVATAIRYYDRLVALDPEYSPAYWGRGWAEKKLNNLAATKKDFVKAFNLRADQVMKAKDADKSDIFYDMADFAQSGLHVMHVGIQQVFTEKADKEEMQKVEATFKKVQDQVFAIQNRENSKIKAQAEASPVDAGQEPIDISPLIIPLSNEMELSQLDARDHYVKFNLDSLSEKRYWSWIRPNAGFLVWVGDSRNPVIRSGRQMFGNVSYFLFWHNGFDALASLDSNHDGKISGEELQGIAIWQDKNGNGVSEPSEILSLKVTRI